MNEEPIVFTQATHKLFDNDRLLTREQTIYFVKRFFRFKACQVDTTTKELFSMGKLLRNDFEKVLGKKMVQLLKLKVVKRMTGILS